MFAFHLVTLIQYSTIQFSSTLSISAICINMTFTFSATKGQGKYLFIHDQFSFFSSCLLPYSSLEIYDVLTEPGHGTKFIATWY